MPFDTTKPRRVVVLTEETFQRLRDKATLTSNQEDRQSTPPPLVERSNEPTGSLAPDPLQSRHPFIQPALKSSGQVVVYNSEQPTDQVPEEHQPNTAETGTDPWTEPGIEESSVCPTDSIPGRFRKSASLLLEQLDDLDDISWVKDQTGVDGEISIDGVGQGVTIQQLLKAVCVPFTATRLSPTIQRFLDRHNIQTRNHLVKSPDCPRWHPYFRL